MSAQEAPVTGIAVVGMSGRFPGAADVEAFWHNLREGICGTTFFSREELAAAGVSAAELADPRYVRAAGLLGGAELFDAELFGLSAREAEVMDPQQRVFLECAWAALEDAGHDPQRFPGWIGVYAGAGLGKYLWLNVAKSAEALAAVGPFQALITNDKDYLATQVSYRLNLRGPSLGVQTACSTSLVAIHLACQALLCFECDLALAGGVAISLPELQGYLYQDDGLSSPDGTCRPFDAAAVGTIRGNGAALVVLKRLADALADGDRVLAVIKGSAINNDGAAKVGFTAPSVTGQAEVIAAAQAVAGVGPETIGYVEAHGTGTALGDPVEVAALTQAFGAAAGGPKTCALGSVKSNVGHLDAAAGVAGLIKAVLALAHGELPPTLHYTTPNPTIDFASGPFYVSAERQPWPASERPRRAGVSAFGIGGTNAHVVLEEAPRLPARQAGQGRPWQLLTLSARSDAALASLAGRLADRLRAHPDLDLGDVAYTLQVGRRELGRRRTVIARDAHEAVERLAAPAAPSAPVDGRPEVAFVLAAAGSTSATAALARELYRDESAFRATVEECCALLDAAQPGRGAALQRALAEPSAEVGDVGEIADADQAQLVRFVGLLALGRLWTSWGAAPSAVLGDGVGEHAAACLAGALPLPTALALVALPVASPTLRDDIRRTVESAHLDPSPTPRIAYVSALMGKRLEGGELTAATHWMNVGARLAGSAAESAPAAKARQESALHLLLEEPSRLLMEVGAAAGLVEKVGRERAVNGLLPAGASGGAGAQEQLVRMLGRLWERGLAVDWAGFHAGESRRRVSLPTYPFEHRRYWVEGPPEAAEGAAVASGAAAARRPLDEWFSIPSWRRTLAPRHHDAASPTDRAAGVCLVLADDCGLGEALGAALGEAGWDVVLAFAGAAWESTGARRCRLRPGDAADHRRLWEELAAGPGLPRRVLHLWNVTAAGPGEPLDEAATAAGLERSFYSLFHLAQSLGRHHGRQPDTPVDLLVLANRLHAVDGGDRPEPLKAALLGICRVLPQDLDHLRCRTVDVEVEGVLEPGGETGRRLLARCLAELSTGWEAPAAESTIAWRGAHRWAPSWEEVSLPLPEPGGAGSPRGLRQGGVYVVTGGLGGVGLEVAQVLAESVRARLVLVGRSAFPGRESWDEWIESHGADDGITRTIARLRSLEAAGAEILVVQADVTSRPQLAALRARIAARFGAVDGIFHAAGVAGGGLLEARSAEQAAAVLAPKVYGTLALAAEFAEASLLVLFSSLNALTGGIGQADYAAANAFLDGFAAARGAAAAGTGGSMRVVSINWDAWRQAGMAAQAAVPEELRAWLAAQLVEAIQPAEGRQVLVRIVAAVGREVGGGDGAETGGPAQIAVSTDPLPRRLAEAAALRLATAIRESAAAAPRAEHPRPAVAPAFAAPATPLEVHLAGLWRQLLGIAPIGRDDGFFELGGHSLLAGQLTSRLRDELGIELPLQAIFTYPTPALLAEALAEIGVQAPGGAEGSLPAAADDLKPLPRESRRIVRSAGEVTDAAETVPAMAPGDRE